MNIIYFIGAIITALWIIYCLTASAFTKKAKQEMEKYREAHDREIQKAEDKLKKLSAEHDSLKNDYEILLKNRKDSDERNLNTLKQKYSAEHHVAKLQKELYTARKRIKKLLGSKKN